MTMDPMWMDGNTVRLELEAPAGTLYSVELPLVALMAQLDDGEIVRFTYDRTDPETGTVIHGAARLVLQSLPDPRDAVTAAPPAPREEWLERPSGPPARILVDGPGCTPAGATVLADGLGSDGVDCVFDSCPRDPEDCHDGCEEAPENQ